MKGHECDRLMPFPEKRALLTPKEVAAVFHRSVDFVEALIDSGTLEAFAPTDRRKQRKRISRRSVLLVLAEQAIGDPSHVLFRVQRVVDVLTREQLERISEQIKGRLSRL